MKRGLLILPSPPLPLPPPARLPLSLPRRRQKIKRATWDPFDGAVIEKWKRLSLTLIKQTCFLRQKQEQGGDEAGCFHPSEIMSLTKAMVAPRGPDPPDRSLPLSSLWGWGEVGLDLKPRWIDNMRKNFSRDVLAPLTANCVWFLMPSLTVPTLILFLAGTQARSLSP